MNDEIIKQAKSLRHDIDNLPSIKEYYRVKDLYEKDEELKVMRTEIARLKSEGKEEERKNLLERYNKHPLVNNYELAKEEVISILSVIKDIIN